MALSVGLIPILAFVITIGIPVSVALTAHQFHRNRDGSFILTLRAAILEASLLYIVSIFVIWSIAGGGSLWGTVAALFVIGLAALVVLMVVPLLVGQQIIQRLGDTDPETALSYATYGWQIALTIVFGIFIAPGGLTHGHLFHLNSETICLAGHCGIGIWLAMAVCLKLVVAVLGPGLLGYLFISTQETV